MTVLTLRVIAASLKHPLEGEEVGCPQLLRVVERVKPRLHLFGHIHEGYGMATRGVTKFVNASICTADYEPTNRPVVIDLS